MVARIRRVFDPDPGVGQLLKLLDDGARFSNEPTDAGRMTEQAEGHMAWRDKERRLWGLRVFGGGGSRRVRAVIGVGSVHSGRSCVYRALYWWKEEGTLRYSFLLELR